MGCGAIAAASSGWAWQAAERGQAGNVERNPLPGPCGLRLSDAAGAFRAMADRLAVFRRFARRLLFQTIHDIALMLDREREGRDANPTAGVLDSQTVKRGWGLRCCQADPGTQTPHRGGYGRAPAHG